MVQRTGGWQTQARLGGAMFEDASKANVAVRPRVRGFMFWQSQPSVTYAPQSGLMLKLANGVPAPVRLGLAVRLQLAVKRLFDIGFSAAVLVLLFPLIIGIALGVRLTSPGPVLFRHMRVGQHGKPIAVLKFRSMYIEHCNEQSCDQVRAQDARVTPLGSFLRSTSLDELPQFLNVLKGDMAVVGPRPHAFGMRVQGIPYERLVAQYDCRQAVKPGISGWAQVNGLRGPADEASHAIARVQHDLAYIQNFSLLLDLWIILLTIRREFIFRTGR